VIEIADSEEGKNNTSSSSTSQSIEELVDTIEILKEAAESCDNDTESQREHVESIRRRYGIGIELNEQSKTVTESLKGVIGRSLESLSHELYNKGKIVDSDQKLLI
jgi:hypothetical protein